MTGLQAPQREAVTPVFGRRRRFSHEQSCRGVMRITIRDDYAGKYNPSTLENLSNYTGVLAHST